MSSTATEHRFWVWRSSPRALIDLAIAFAVFVVSLVLMSHAEGSQSDREVLDPIGVLLVAGSSAPLVAWRRYPVTVFVATSVSSVLLAGLGYSFGLALGPAVALYLVAATRERGAPWTWPTATVVATALVTYVAAVAMAAGSLLAAESIHAGLPWVAAWFAGERTRLRRERIAELKERALTAERAAERERRLATAEERARIARDLHDSAGHAVNVIAVRAGAARMGHARDPARAQAALEAIEQLAQQTAAEIDQIVGTLRERGEGDNHGGVETPVGLASLDSLIADHAASGLHVTLDESGNRRPLGSVVDQASYRILQEALTNAARHGTGRARVEVVFGATAVDLTVTNPVAANGSSQSGGGHGLIGMGERAMLVGGELASERANGTFRITARIPYAGRCP